MQLPTNRCTRCLEFMVIRKIDGEYHMICPYCEEEEKEKNQNN